jgi:hypothetical protein
VRAGGRRPRGWRGYATSPVSKRSVNSPAVSKARRSPPRPPRDRDAGSPIAGWVRTRSAPDELCRAVQPRSCCGAGSSGRHLARVRITGWSLGVGCDRPSPDIGRYRRRAIDAAAPRTPCRTRSSRARGRSSRRASSSPGPSAARSARTGCATCWLATQSPAGQPPDLSCTGMITGPTCQWLSAYPKTTAMRTRPITTPTARPPTRSLPCWCFF